MFVDLEDADLLCLEQLDEIRLDARVQKYAKLLRKPLLGQRFFSPHELDQEVARVLGPQAHLPRRAYLDRESVGGFHVLGLRARTPFDRHLFGLVDEVHLAVKWRGVAGGSVEKPFHVRQVVGFEAVPPRPEQVERLPVSEEHRFLRFVNDELCAGVEVLYIAFPDKGGVVALIFIVFNLLFAKYFPI